MCQKQHEVPFMHSHLSLPKTILLIRKQAQRGLATCAKPCTWQIGQNLNPDNPTPKPTLIMINL